MSNNKNYAAMREEFINFIHEYREEIELSIVNDDRWDDDYSKDCIINNLEDFYKGQPEKYFGYHQIEDNLRHDMNTVCDDFFGNACEDEEHYASRKDSFINGVLSFYDDCYTYMDDLKQMIWSNEYDSGAKEELKTAEALTADDDTCYIKDKIVEFYGKQQPRFFGEGYDSDDIGSITSSALSDFEYYIDHPYECKEGMTGRAAEEDFGTFFDGIRKFYEDTYLNIKIMEDDFFGIGRDAADYARDISEFDVERVIDFYENRCGLDENYIFSPHDFRFLVREVYNDTLGYQDELLKDEDENEECD